MTDKDREERKFMSDCDDFVDVINHLTNFVGNERVAAYNEGVDMMLENVRRWMIANGISPTSGNDLPGLLNEIKQKLRQPND